MERSKLEQLIEEAQDDLYSLRYERVQLMESKNKMLSDKHEKGIPFQRGLLLNTEQRIEILTEKIWLIESDIKRWEKQLAPKTTL